MEELSEGDSYIDILDKVRRAVKTNYKIVVWRRAMLVSLLSSAIIIPILYILQLCASDGVDISIDGFDYFMVASIVFTVVYFSETWLQSHWHKMNSNKINRSVLELRSRVLQGTSDF